MQRLLKTLAQVAPSRATVLIAGESGTGKELIASAIHQSSPRSDAPFVRLNCAALAESLLESELFGHERGAFTGAVTRREGRFKQAHGGTLFLDEISELPLGVQAKLLRFLQERQFERVGGNETLTVDVRVVAATNRDLRERMTQGLFREDLYYRLNVVQLEVPPLRVRRSDIPLAHPWPGNVRELENAMERAVVLSRGEQITPEDLAALASGSPESERASLLIPGMTLAGLERIAITQTLQAVGGSTAKAAEMLGISQRKIQYRLKEWGVGTDESNDA